MDDEVVEPRTATPMSKFRPLNWSQRVTMRMISDGRSPAGGSSYLDPTGLGIPGGTLRSLRQRGLIERYAWFSPGWVLTKAGVDAIRSGECDEPEDREAVRDADTEVECVNCGEDGENR